jgi:DNA-binding transcriptional ArsR family regulator
VFFGGIQRIVLHSKELFNGTTESEHRLTVFRGKLTLYTTTKQQQNMATRINSAVKSTRKNKPFFKDYSDEYYRKKSENFVLRFNKHAVDTSFYRQEMKSFNRILNYRLCPEGIWLPDREKKEKFADTKITLGSMYPAFVHGLNGCSCTLLHFILFYELNTDENVFKTGVQLRQRFNDYCNLFDDVKYSDETVRKALKTLKQKNIILSLHRGKSMVNPLLLGIYRLAHEYTRHLLNQGKDSVLHFYPRVEMATSDIPNNLPKIEFNPN